MEQLKSMKEQLTSLVQGQLAHTDCVDTKELGEAVDMIKDLAETIYYCTITEAMKEKEKQPQQQVYYYTERPYYPMEYYRDMDRDYGRMYYGENISEGERFNGSMRYPSYNNGRMQSGRGTSYYSGGSYPMEIRDSREGRSPMSRRMYMESKEMHQDKAKQMQELEKYMRELGDDITEMIEDASPEEKQLLQQKIATLAAKIK